MTALVIATTLIVGIAVVQSLFFYSLALKTMVEKRICLPTLQDKYSTLQRAPCEANYEAARGPCVLLI